jgi:hypothetical protein
MAYNYFSPKPGRLGVHPTVYNSGRLNTGTLATSPQTHNIGAQPAKAYINRATLCAETYPTATTITATLNKVNAAGVTALTAALDINAKTADIPLQFTFLTTLTDAQRTFTQNDSLRITLAWTGSVTVQPDDITVSPEMLVME